MIPRMHGQWSRGEKKKKIVLRFDDCVFVAGVLAAVCVKEGLVVWLYDVLWLWTAGALFTLCVRIDKVKKYFLTETLIRTRGETYRLGEERHHQ